MYVCTCVDGILVSVDVCLYLMKNIQQWDIRIIANCLEPNHHDFTLQNSDSSILFHVHFNFKATIH